MNLISFANFTQADNQNAFPPSAEKDGKSEDFSMLLQSIFLALQTANSPVTNFSNGFEQIQTFSEGEQNFVVGNAPVLPENFSKQPPVLVSNTEKKVSLKITSNQTNTFMPLNLPTDLPPTPGVGETIHISSLKTETLNLFSPSENLISIPANFQPVPKLPVVQNLWSENNISENLPKIPQTDSTKAQPQNIDPSLTVKDFEILPDNQQNNVQLEQNISLTLSSKSAQNNNLPQVFRNVSNSIRKNDLPKEISFKIVLPINNFAETTTEAVKNDAISEPSIKVTSEIVNPIIDLPSSAEPGVEVEISAGNVPFDLNLEPNLQSEPELKVEPNLQFEPEIKAQAPLTQNQFTPKASILSVTEPPPPIEDSTNPVTKPKTNFVLEPQIKLNTGVIPANVLKTKAEIDLSVEKIAEGVEPSAIKPEAEQNLVNNFVSGVESKSPATLPDLSVNSPELPAKEPQNLIADRNSFSQVEETKLPVEPVKIISSENDLIVSNLPNEDFSQPLSSDKKSVSLNPFLPTPADAQLPQIKVPTEESFNKTSNDLNLADDEIFGLIDKIVEKTNISATDKTKSANYPPHSEQTVKNPFQPIETSENQSPDFLSNNPIQLKKEVKIKNVEIDFSPKNDNESKFNETEINQTISFNKVIENTTKTAETAVNPQIEPAKIAEQISPHLLALAALVEKNDEKEILKMRLHPAELGTVEITLERDSSGVLNAHFKTETADAQQALSKGLEQLRDNLQNSGWEIGKLEITNNSNSTTDNQPRQQNQPKADWLENFIFSRSSDQPDEAENKSPQRLLNLLA